MNPFFSIIIPVFNVAPYLRECLNSVLAQTFRDWEAICVDDGSTDESSVILDEYSADDKRFRVIHQPNAGVVTARLNGFGASIGSRILFLDGDDRLCPNTLEKLHSVPNSVDCIKFGFRHIKTDGTPGRVFVPHLDGAFSREEVLDEIKQSPLEVLGMCIGDKCYRRDVVDKAFNSIGHVRIAHSEDGLFALASFWCSRALVFMKDILYDYRYRESSASHVFNSAIVDYKAIFIATAVDIARHTGEQPEEWCRKEFDYHARQALGYIFVMSLGRQISMREAYNLLKSMARKDFFLHEKSHWNPARHFVMRFLVCHPLTCVIFRCILRKIIASRCQSTLSGW